MINNYKMYIFLNFISVIMIFFIILMSVGFLTLFERKILSYMQLRKGPNKVGFFGLFQPFSDAIKLFTKEMFIIMKSNYWMFYISPIIMIFLMLSMWLIMDIYSNIYYLNYSLLIVFMLLTLMSYVILFLGWSSNSMYSMIGIVRNISQTLSYEVSFIIIMLSLMIMSESFSFLEFMKWQKYMFYMLIWLPMFLSFWISILAELNRTPMDFIEGESELVSGFNVEYFSSGFAMIFMAEYGMIMFFSYLMLTMFTNLIFSLYISIFMMMFVMMIIIMRGILPRMRYDELMYLCWKIILPLVLNYFIYIMGLKFIFLFIFYEKINSKLKFL